MTACTLISIEKAIEEAAEKYTARFPKSRAQHEGKAVKFMPGGNTRSLLYNDPFPLCMQKGVLNYLWDIDGNRYLDLVGELSAGLYGHSNPKIQEAIISTLQEVGLSLGSTNMHETAFAELITQRFSSIEQLRFCNSGTEANLYALSIAKHVTGKRKVIVFDGGYHGGVLSFGNGVSKGNVDQDDWVVGVYNDVEGFKNLVESAGGGGAIAAVIVEAMQGAGGCIPATKEFLHAIQDAALKYKFIFILDEIVTSRLQPSGLQGLHKLKPHLTTLGKYLGGGLAFGCFGGQSSLLSTFDPRLATSLSHSGTFNNNTLAMVAGFTGLSLVYTPSENLSLNSLGDYFRDSLTAVAKGTKMVVTGVGAVLTVHFLESGKEPVNATEIRRERVEGLGRLFWFWCLERGYWVTERGMLALILGTTKEELEEFVGIVGQFVRFYADFLKVDDAGPVAS